MRGLILTAGLTILLLARSPYANDELPLPIQAHRASIESLQSLQLHVNCSVLDAEGKQMEAYGGEYWRQGDLVRELFVGQKGTIDAILERDRAMTLRSSKQAGKVLESLTIEPPRSASTEVDAWYWSLCQLPLSTEILSLSELYEGRTDKKTCESVLENGREAFHVDVSWSGKRLQAWLDPRVNHLIGKVSLEEKDSSTIAEVTSFREAAPSLFFPERMEHRFYISGKFSHRVKVSFEDIRINKSIPASIFKPRYHKGLKVYDLIRGVEYDSDDQGNSLEPVKKYEPMKLSELPPEGVTREAEGHSWFWIGLLVLGLAAIGASVWLLKKRRPQS